MALEFRKGYFVAVSGRRKDRLDAVVEAMSGKAFPSPVM